MNPITATASFKIVIARLPLYIEPGKAEIGVLDMTQLIKSLTQGDLWTHPPHPNR